LAISRELGLPLRFINWQPGEQINDIVFRSTETTLLLTFRLAETEHDIRVMHVALELARRASASLVQSTVASFIFTTVKLSARISSIHSPPSHAEVVALKRPPANKRAAATASVTLEPCNIIGRTGPAPRIVGRPEARAWVAATRIQSTVACRGFWTLRAAGITVRGRSLLTEASA